MVITLLTFDIFMYIRNKAGSSCLFSDQQIMVKVTARLIYQNCLPSVICTHQGQTGQRYLLQSVINHSNYRWGKVHSSVVVSKQ